MNNTTSISNATITIDKGVPLPTQRTHSSKIPAIYEMSTGESTFISGLSKDDLNRMRVRLSAHGRRHGKAYATRTLTEDGVKGLRIWRTK